MARAGVTDEEVFVAADTIEASGQTVTIARVRDALGGTGSYTTISRHLEVWRERRDSEKQDELPAVPGSIEETMVNAVRTIWQQAMGLARSEFESLREGLRAETTEKEHALSEAHSEIDRLERDFEKQEHATAAAQEKFEKANETAMRLSIEHQAAQAEIERLRDELVSARAEAREARDEAAELRGRVQALEELSAAKKKTPRT